MENTLYFGDNLKILREYIPDNSIDLIYLDPPFKSGKDYNILYKEPNGVKSEAQTRAFKDTWHWGENSEETFSELVDTASSRLIELLRSFRSFLHENDMMAYLVMMAIRLIELERVLKDTGSIYLHCDPTASHYLKILLDIIFHPKNFQNEIIWFFKSGGATKRRFARKHHIIFFYSKSERYKFNPQKEKSYMMHKYGFKKSNFKTDEKGQYSMVYMKDVWEIPALGSATSERLGYPTQKPLELLKKIIKNSTNENDIVLDPFCGCGTTIDAAIGLKRKWIGIDITYLSTSLIKYRIENRYGKKIEYNEIGSPEDLKSAYKLASLDRFEFQRWASGLVIAKPIGDILKKGADKGIDGVKYFQDRPNKKDIRKIVIQVKSGHVGVKDIRELITVTKNNNGDIGVFITLKNPTGPMRKEAISEGFYITFEDQKFPKIQILTIEELLEGKQIEYPNIGERTFKKAKPYFDESQKGKQTQLDV